MCQRRLQVGNILAKAGARSSLNEAFQVCDWTAVTWQLRGLSLAVVALCREASEGGSPANYSKFAQVAA